MTEEALREERREGRLNRIDQILLKQCLEAKELQRAIQEWAMHTDEWAQRTEALIDKLAHSQLRLAEAIELLIKNTNTKKKTAAK